MGQQSQVRSLRVACRVALARAGVVALVALGAVAVAAPVAAPASAAVTRPDAAVVRAAQSALGVTADGVIGPQTRRAIRRFQRRAGLTVDGVLGRATLRALGVRVRTARAQSRPAPSSPGAGAGAVLERIARCESGGNPAAVSPDGRYRGKYQFTLATWRALGGTGDPARAPEAEQDRLAAKLLAQSGTAPWGACA